MSVVPSAGAVEYSIYNKATASQTFPSLPDLNTIAGELRFGKSDASHNGTSPSQRYNTIDLGYVYVK